MGYCLGLEVGVSMRSKYLIVVLLFIFVGIAATLLASPPEPSGVNIIPPDPSLPAEIKALSGKWVGQWNSRFPWDSVLYVEKLSKDSARVTHSYGDYTTANMSCHCTPDYLRIHNAKVTYSDGKASVEFAAHYRNHMLNHTSNDVRNKMDEQPGKHGTYASFTLDKDKPDVLKGMMISGHRHQILIEMKKVE
jgi:hypothetical protein